MFSLLKYCFPIHIYTCDFIVLRCSLMRFVPKHFAWNTSVGSIAVPLTSCLTGLELSVLQIKTKIVSCHTADSKPVKQEVNGTGILPPLVFPAFCSTEPCPVLFYGRNYCFIVISSSVWCCQSLPPLSNICRQALILLKCSPLHNSSTMVRSQPYLQILD